MACVKKMDIFIQNTNMKYGELFDDVSYVDANNEARTAKIKIYYNYTYGL